MQELLTLVTQVPFEEGNLTVPVEPMSWPEGKAERVSVNCFGIGGTNVHVCSPFKMIPLVYNDCSHVAGHSGVVPILQTSFPR